MPSKFRFIEPPRFRLINWVEVREDAVIANTITDQLAHTNMKLVLEDESYRWAKRRGYKSEHPSLHGSLEQESLQTESEGGPLG